MFLNKIKNNVNIILPFITSIFVAFLLGLIIVYIVDNRLSKISINIPKSNIIIKNSEIEQFSQQKKVKENKKNKEEKIINRYENFVNKDNNSETICIINHKHIEEDCTKYGACHYLHPNKMSNMDKHIFKTNYPKNMTLQDYINWLWLYINESDTKSVKDNLTKEHLINLNKLKNKEEITYKMIPQIIDKPINDIYYKKLNSKENINDLSPIGYNYIEYSEYKSPSHIK